MFEIELLEPVIKVFHEMPNEHKKLVDALLFKLEILGNEL